MEVVTASQDEYTLLLHWLETRLVATPTLLTSREEMAVPVAGRMLGLHSDVESLEFVLLTSWQQQFEEINTHSTQATPCDQVQVLLSELIQDEQLVK